MKPVNIGIVGLGNVGSGSLDILAGNAGSIENKLGFPICVAAVCSRSIASKKIPQALSSAKQTADWKQVVEDPEIDIVAELVGGVTVAREIVEASFAAGKSVVTANKELMALAGVDLWKQAQKASVGLAMEASVAGGIPILDVLREGIAADRISTLYGILNGTSNYILTAIEQDGADFDSVLADAQNKGLAEADPTADVDGLDARSKLAILTGLAFGQQVDASSIFTEGIRRITPVDFAYAHQLHHTIRLVASARRLADAQSGTASTGTTDQGLILSVRPSLIAQSTILAGVRGAYNAVWVRGDFGADTFYYGQGAGPHPTGVAVVSDVMRMARDLRSAKGVERVAPFGHAKLETYQPVPVDVQTSAYFLRFRVKNQHGIIAQLATALAEESVSIDAVLQLPEENWRDLPFVITTEPATEASIRAALARMQKMDFLVEPPLAMPIEKAL